MTAHEEIPLKYRPAESVYRHPVTNVLYHLHPELVFGKTVFDNGTDAAQDPQCHLCHTCMRALTKPEFPYSYHSLVAGVDFGLASRINLPQLSVVEELLISPVRIYHTIVKITHPTSKESAFKGHVCSFQQDSVKQAVNVILPRCDDVRDNVYVTFLGPKEKYEKKLRAALPAVKAGGPGPLAVRPKVVYEWLKALAALNPRFSHYGHKIDEGASMMEVQCFVV